MTTTLARTPLDAWHRAAGGKMVDFAGWSMPVLYDSIVREHLATRQGMSLFDVSHMGRLKIVGEQAEAFLDQTLTRRVTSMKPGQIRYSLVCQEDGGTLDDVLVYRLPPSTPHGYDAWQLVVNASNREKIVAWLAARQEATGSDVTIDDETAATAMIAVQGPRAVETVGRLIDIDLKAMRYYRSQAAQLGAVDVFVSRTGYTGEDGCELILDADVVLSVWERILEAGRSAGAVAAGLGARDTLRLEAGMPLYGHELNDQITPLQAGLGFACDFGDRQFVGRAALLAARDDAQLPNLVGLRMTGRRVPRERYPVFDGQNEVGQITSGTFSPTFEAPLAMAFVAPASSGPGRELSVDIRGRLEPAKVVKLPFYQRESR